VFDIVEMLQCNKNNGLIRSWGNLWWMLQKRLRKSRSTECSL